MFALLQRANIHLCRTAPRGRYTDSIYRIFCQNSRLISPDNFRRKVWQLDVGDMLMIGRRTADKLRNLLTATISLNAIATAFISSREVTSFGIVVELPTL